MKDIIIKESNKEKINEIIKKADGRARERIIESYEELVKICESVEDRLKPMTKKAMDGTKIHYDFRDHFPRAYKYTPASTHVDLIFKNGSWRLVDIYRDTCPNLNCCYYYRLELSETAKESVLNRFI